VPAGQGSGHLRQVMKLKLSQLEEMNK